MRNIIKIIKISRPLHGLAFLIAFLILLGASIELVSPILSKYIVDEIVAKLQGSGGDFGRLTFLIGMAFAANIFGIILTAATERLGDHFAGKLRKYLTERFYEKVLTLPQSYFDGAISGKIVNQLNRAIFTIQNFINGSSNFILPMILQSIFTIAVLSIYSLQIAFFTFALFPIYILISYWSAKKWGEYEVSKNKIEDITRGRIVEVVSNIKLVKSFGSQKREYGLVSNNLSSVNRIFAKQSTSYHFFNFARNLSLQLILLVISVIVFYSTFRGEMTIGTMVLILQLINQARRPLFAMSFILSNIQAAEAGSKEYFEILELKSAEDFSANFKTRIGDGTVEFKNVTFSYEKSGVVLKNVSFKIERNEKAALVGPSGTGKTTIANLILKFYEPTKGDILIAGRSYKKLDHSFVRNNISLVFQDAELFSTTVFENVSYGSSKHTRAQVIEALKLANAWDFVRKLPRGLESQVGERGVKLSGGQKQRIQIARAILKNSPILILDEATSSLDSKSEREVQAALDNLMRGKLVIIIAHRFSTIQNVDKVIAIEEGRVMDIGSPQELAKKPGIYSELLKYQIEGNAKLLEKFEIY